jgi:hypothetical protein
MAFGDPRDFPRAWPFDKFLSFFGVMAPERIRSNPGPAFFFMLSWETRPLSKSTTSSILKQKRNTAGFELAVADLLKVINGNLSPRCSLAA